MLEPSYLVCWQYKSTELKICYLFEERFIQRQRTLKKSLECDIICWYLLIFFDRSQAKNVAFGSFHIKSPRISQVPMADMSDFIET